MFEFERMAEANRFITLNAEDPVEAIQKVLRRELGTLLMDETLSGSIVRS